MKVWLRKSLLIISFILLGLLIVILFAFSVFLVKKVEQKDGQIKEKDTRIAALESAPQKRDPFLDYALRLEKYDTGGAKPIKFSCYEKSAPENMSAKDKFWYESGPHDPPIPENDEKIKIVQNKLSEDGNGIYKLCISSIAPDYLVISNKGTSADLYRFYDTTHYLVQNVSDKFTFFSVLKWLGNGDFIYDVDDSDWHAIYVFTAKNDDILLEYCHISMDDTDENLKGVFTCKNFNDVTNTSSYLPSSLLNDWVGWKTF
jgi:hypothetical protein